MTDHGPLGAVLAGGRSRRFGAPKERALFLGEPLGRRTAATLEPICFRVVLVGGTPALEEPGMPPRIQDLVEGAGPLGGLHAALTAAADAGSDAVLLVACDMPLLSPRMVEQVLCLGRSAGRPAAAPAPAPNRWHPLCGWYSVACLPTVEERLAGSDRSLHGLLTALGAHPIPLARLVGPDSGLRAVEMGLRSANTPDALARMEAEAGAGGPVPAVSVFGYKDSGKTGVAVELVTELRRRGYRVGAVKHGHGFSLDTPGTDSWRLRHEGDAERVLLAGPEGFGLMGRWGPEGEAGVEELLRTHFVGKGMDVVVVEGYKSGPLPGVEVFRGDLHGEPFAARDEPRRGALLALVCDAAGLACLEARWTDRFLPPPERVSLDAPGRVARLADLVERDVMGRTDGGEKE